MDKECQAHNLKAVGSNPTPATNFLKFKNFRLLTSHIDTCI